MPAILKNDFSVINAEGFINSLIDGTSNLYMSIGRTTEWSSENIPPTPVDSLAIETEARNAIIGIKRVPITNIMLLVPRVNWEAGKEFSPISTTTANPLRATNYFCINQHGYVYQCIHTPGSGALTQVGSEPMTMASEITGVDGYKWKFLYDVTQQMTQNGLLLNSWMPVPYNKHGVYPGGSLTSYQNLYGDKNANHTLGAFRVIAVVTLGNEGTDIPSNTEFRQVSLLYDPKDSSGNFISGGTYALSEFDKTSGQMIYLENRKVIIRDATQEETLTVIVSF